MKGLSCFRFLYSVHGVVIKVVHFKTIMFFFLFIFSSYPEPRKRVKKKKSVRHRLTRVFICSYISSKKPNITSEAGKKPPDDGPGFVLQQHQPNPS